LRSWAKLRPALILHDRLQLGCGAAAHGHAVDAVSLHLAEMASLCYARKIPAWQQAGCSIALVYLRLPSVEMSIERVRRRVAQGGHGVPEDAIRKRFTKSLDYFERLYRPIVNEWYIWDSLEGSFEPAEKWDDL
jgi:hypothetical protein